MLARERVPEKATHDGSDVVHGNVVTTPDLMGGITLLGAVLVHNDELGGRCGCSKRNKPRRHFDCVASGTATDDDSSDGFGGSGFSFRIRPDEPQDSHNQPDPPTSRTIVSRTVKSKIAKQVLVRKQELFSFFDIVR